MGRRLVRGSLVREPTGGDSLLQVLLHRFPNHGRRLNVGRLVLVGRQDMVHQRRGPPQGHQVEIHQCPEHLGFCHAALSYGRLLRHVFHDQVGPVQDRVITGEQALDRTHARIETIVRQLVISVIVGATPMPEVVGEVLLGEPHIVVVGLIGHIDRGYRFLEVGVRGIEFFHAHHAVLTDVQLAFAGAEGQERREGENRQMDVFHNSMIVKGLC